MNKLVFAITAMLLSGSAFAQDVPANAGLGNAVMMVAFLFIFYFMIWRPQSKRAKEHKNLISNLKQGDEVLTSGGLLGEITKLGDDYVSLKLAQAVEIKIQKSAIINAMPKGTLTSV